MTIDIKIPILPESVSDGTIVKWYKTPGEWVQKEERLLDVETDKIVLEVVAPVAGQIEQSVKAVGDKVKSEEIVGRIIPKTIIENSTPIVKSPENDLLSPSKRRSAKSETHFSYLSVTPPTLTPEVTAVGKRSTNRVPMTRLRARIAERLLEAQQSAAILTTFNEINMQAVMVTRQKYKENFEKAYGVRLGLMSFFVTAVVEALEKFPILNAYREGDDILYPNYYDIGMAVASDRGLVVPILRNADPIHLPFPMMGILNGLGQWIFDRTLVKQPNILSVVTTGPLPHSDPTTLLHTIHNELYNLLPNLTPPIAGRVITEKRAAFQCSVGFDDQRPPAKTAYPNLVLAGDYLHSYYPATLESAVQSGIQAAKLL